MSRVGLTWVLLAVATGNLWGQRPLIVRDVGPGRPGRILVAALNGPHTVIDGQGDTADLPVGQVYATGVIVLAQHVTIDATVDGDVIVVGGNAFVHRGAHVTGRVIAIGGVAYCEPGCQADGGAISFRDETFAVTRLADTIALDYRVLSDEGTSWVSLPGLWGIGTPAYDRSDGMSLPATMNVQVDSARLLVAPTLTYRSALGAWDPSLMATFALDRRTRLSLDAGRGTLTNEGWIVPDGVNSLTAVIAGLDTRNWYRADRATATVSRMWEGMSSRVEPYASFAVERAWSVSPDSNAASGAWSAFRRGSRSALLRPNPAIDPGTISSADLGAHAAWTDEGIDTKLSANVEIANHTPQGAVILGPASGPSRFVQATVDGAVEFPTFGAQDFRVEVRAIGTRGEAPLQRRDYLGGLGTLATLGTLQLGGDQLLFIDSRYDIPLAGLTVPVVGAPVLTLHHVLGTAGVGGLPALTQLLGVRLSLYPVAAEIMMDVAARRLHGTVGLSIIR